MGHGSKKMPGARPARARRAPGALTFPLKRQKHKHRHTHRQRERERVSLRTARAQWPAVSTTSQKRILPHLKMFQPRPSTSLKAKSSCDWKQAAVLIMARIAKPQFTASDIRAAHSECGSVPAMASSSQGAEGLRMVAAVTWCQHCALCQARVFWHLEYSHGTHRCHPLLPNTHAHARAHTHSQDAAFGDKG